MKTVRVAASVALATAAFGGMMMTGLAEEAANPGRAIAAMANDLGFDLLREADPKENVFLSPESIAVALGMTSLGAKGETLAAFDKVLRIPTEARDVFHAHIGRRGGEDGEGFTIRSANRLFGQKGHPFRPTFKDAVQKSYGGAFEEVDFKSDHRGVRTKINGWVSDQTNKMIPELLPDGVPAPTSRLVLVNAIYFKAKWEDPFEKESTRERAFHLTATSDVKTSFMAKTEYLALAESDSCTLLALPYKGGRFEAVFLLPKKDDVFALTKELSSFGVGALRAKATTTYVDVLLPRFRFGWGKDLVPDLRKLGLGPACSASADFSAMADPSSEPLFVGAVIHKAIVALDEEGTEAAAATAVDMRAGSVPPKPVPFHADRPFVFAIRDVKTGGLVFLGRVIDPSVK